MDLSHPDEEAIDTTCERRLPDRDTPDDIAPQCKGNAVTWFQKTDGTRIYVCREHAREVLRFGGDDEEELHELSREELEEEARSAGISLDSPSREDLIRRLVSKKDPAELREHPVVRICDCCLKPTLRGEMDHVTDKCLSCSGDKCECDPEEFLPGA